MDPLTTRWRSQHLYKSYNTLIKHLTIMANDKFEKVIRLIREVIGLITDLIPVADTALELIETVRDTVRKFKEEQGLTQ